MKNRYEVSEEFKQSCKENIGLNRYGRLHIIEDDIDIISENYNGQLVDFKIEDNCYVKDTFIGTTVAKKITVNILNPNNEINLENKTIEVYVGIEIEGRLEEIPYGIYIVEKPDNEEVKQKTSFTGYDYMIKFNPKYQNRVEYPIKLSSLLEDLCNQVGLELGNKDFVNADYMVLGNPFTNNEDCRTVLSNIAQLAGGFAKIGRDNKLYIKTLKKFPNLIRVKDIHNMPVKDLHLLPVSMLSTYKDNTEENLDGNNYFDDFSKNEQWGNVNSLVLSMSDIEGENTTRTDEESISKNGLTEITIADNYFLINEEERNKVIEPLWESLKGLRYLPFKAKYYGYPHLDSGDPIAVEDTQNVQYLSYVLNHTFIFNGAFDGKLETIAMTKMQTAYKNTQDTKTKLKRAERKIDKINGLIEDILEEQTETESKLSQHQQTIDSITDKVSSVTEELNTAKEELKGDIEQAENDINKNLQDNYYTKTETNSQITQKADSITSEVNKTISTAKQEAIDSANSSTDNKLKNYSTTTQMNSAITQKAESITSEVNQTIKEAKEEAINSANTSTDNKLKNYSTTTQMNSAIMQKANEITSTVSETYSTKKETDTAKQSAIDSANSATDTKLKNYSTTTQMNSAITQKADTILASVSADYATKTSLDSVNKTLTASLELKVDTDKLISEINASADRISLTAGRLVINSGNFLLDEYGNITVENATIKSGNIDLQDDGQFASSRIHIEGGTTSQRFNSYMGSYSILFQSNLGYGDFQSQLSSTELVLSKMGNSHSDYNYVSISAYESYGGEIILKKGDGNPNYTSLRYNEIFTNGEIYAASEVSSSQFSLIGSNSTILSSSSNSNYFGTNSNYSGLTTILRGNDVRLYAHTGGVYLGSSGSTAVTSDENLKNISDIDNKYIEFFKNLKPITYIYKNNGHRNHIGFGARQVEKALTSAGLTTEQFAGILIDKDINISADEMGTEEDIHFDELYSLRYEEFIALNTLMIQKLIEKIEKLEGVK